MSSNVDPYTVDQNGLGQWILRGSWPNCGGVVLNYAERERAEDVSGLMNAAYAARNNP